jgi:hypothetical protein
MVAGMRASVGNRIRLPEEVDDRAILEAVSCPGISCGGGWLFASLHKHKRVIRSRG